MPRVVTWNPGKAGPIPRLELQTVAVQHTVMATEMQGEMQMQTVITMQELFHAKRWLLYGERPRFWRRMKIDAAARELLFRRDYVTNDTDAYGPRSRRAEKNAMIFV